MTNKIIRTITYYWSINGVMY